MLYSLNGSRPAPLPFRIHIGGTTRTDPSTFTEDEITAAGFTGPFTEPPYNTATEQLDWVDGAYVITTLPPPPVEPRWIEFSAALMAHPAVKAMLIAAVTTEPGYYGGLSVGLNEASRGDPRVFIGSWMALQQIGLISIELAVALQAEASKYDLPAEFVAALLPWRFPESPARGDDWTAPDGSQWTYDQPRNPDGTYAADDPATAKIESALMWAPTPSPD